MQITAGSLHDIAAFRPVLKSVKGGENMNTVKVVQKEANKHKYAPPVEFHRHTILRTGSTLLAHRRSHGAAEFANTVSCVIS